MGEDVLEAEETLALAGLVNTKYLEIKETYEAKKTAHDQQLAALEQAMEE
jgi:hypothetical protein